MLWSLLGTLVLSIGATLVVLLSPRSECLGIPGTPVWINHIASELDGYRMRLRAYPPSLETLVATKRLYEDQLFDPWGQPVRYVVHGDDYHLCSGGHDEELDTDDDICRTKHGEVTP